MEEKKFDLNTIIGFLLIGAILLFMLWQNQPTPEELEAQKLAKEKSEQVENDKNSASTRKNRACPRFNFKGRYCYYEEIYSDTLLIYN